MAAEAGSRWRHRDSVERREQKDFFVGEWQTWKGPAGKGDGEGDGGGDGARDDDGDDDASDVLRSHFRGHTPQHSSCHTWDYSSEDRGRMTHNLLYYQTK